jgi:hypothetical protein
MATLYLNNDGSRWVDNSPNAMDFVLVLPDGTRKQRKARYYESFGNFAVIAYTYKGKLYKGMPKASNGSETWLDNEPRIPHVFHK